MKAGTSSLHEYLHQHPQIFMSRFKEPQYFAPHATRWGQMWGQGNPYPEPGIDWYLRLFEDAGDVRYAGESSVSYTARPWVEDCEQRIFEFNPKARLIYLVRDPIERAISHYWYFVKDGREDRDMLTAFRRKEEYIARSDYARQLQPYFERFPREQIHLLSVEELNIDPQATFRELFEWLSVDADVPIDIEKKYNVSVKHLRQTRRGLVPVDTALKHWRFKPYVQRLPQPARELINRITYRPVDSSGPGNEKAVDYLREILEPKMEAFFELAGRDFCGWGVGRKASGEIRPAACTN